MKRLGVSAGLIAPIHHGQPWILRQHGIRDHAILTGKMHRQLMDASGASQDLPRQEDNHRCCLVRVTHAADRSGQQICLCSLRVVRDLTDQVRLSERISGSLAVLPRCLATGQSGIIIMRLEIHGWRVPLNRYRNHGYTEERIEKHSNTFDLSQIFVIQLFENIFERTSGNAAHRPIKTLSPVVPRSRGMTEAMTETTTAITRRATIIASAATAAVALAAPARAEASQIRLSHGFGIHYLPLMVIRHRKLLEKHLAATGLTPEITWRSLDGGSSINDAMISGALDIAGIGAPGFITLWSKARNIPASAVIGLSALGGGALWLNTNNPNIRSLRDFTAKDKIAVPGIKTSFAAVVLQMAAAKEFGVENYARLDPLTVGLAHPDAFATLVSGKTEITGHVASPPFSNKELSYPNIHRVFTTVDLLGPITIDVAYAPKRFADANPRIIDAFLAAMDEANALIAADRDGAAESFLAVSEVNMPKAEIRALLDDPETNFKTAPSGVMSYAEFLGKTGQIKTVPQGWTDLFVSQLHSRVGS
eukprot:gene2013-2052_t